MKCVDSRGCCFSGRRQVFRVFLVEEPRENKGRMASKAIATKVKHKEVFQEALDDFIEDLPKDTGIQTEFMTPEECEADMIKCVERTK